MVISLDKLKLRQSGIVNKISCSEPITRRLNDLGLLIGTTITPVFSSPFGDPTAFEFRGNIIAIRSEDSSKIFVNTEI